MADTTKNGRKVTRSRLGCETCRARKVRCDERPGRCFNCERLGLICAPSGRRPSADKAKSPATSPQDPDGLVHSSGLKRKRTYRSCQECRTSKTRCSGHKPACVRCNEKSLACNYDDDSEPVWKQRVAVKTNHHGNHAPSVTSSLAGADRTPNSAVSPLRRADTTPAASNGLASPEASLNTPSAFVPEDLTWLLSNRLPEHARIRLLVERYFANVHHLRCFAFLHKPSFLQRLDSDASKDHEGNPLLLIVCALGALFYAVEYETSRGISLPINPLDAGKHWADRAQNLVLARVDKISVENLMAAVLLHDYDVRMGHYSIAFMLSAITARMAQALQINLEHSTDVLCRDTSKGAPPASVKESRRRLMWCCYITDSLVGSGIDQLTLIDESDIKIQLPCNERNFVLEEPCITETLEPGQMLKFLPPDVLPTYPQDCMGMTAFYLRHINTRRKVLKYIKHLDEAKAPWLPDSEFAQLDAELRYWYDNLPSNLQFTPTTLYIRQETSQVGALCALHYAYHQTMCDLYRIGAPGLYKLRSAFAFPPEQTAFHRHLQWTLFTHARSLATIMAEALQHGPHAIADSWLPTILYDSCKIMLFYMTQLIDPSLDTSKSLMVETLPHIRNNVKALNIMRSMYSAAEPLAKAAHTMLEKIGIEFERGRCGSQNFITEDPYSNHDNEEADRSTHSAPGTPVQSAPDYVLNPLSIYNLARKSIPEKHAPERQPQQAQLVSIASCPPTMSRPTPVPRSSSQQIYPTNGRVEGDDSVLAQGYRPEPIPAEQMNFEELQSLFTSDPTGWTWQPAETAVGSRNEATGLPPWESTSLEHQLDAWLPTFALDP